MQNTLNNITQVPPNLFFCLFISKIEYETLSIKIYIVNKENNILYVIFNIRASLNYVSVSKNPDLTETFVSILKNAFS